MKITNTGKSASSAGQVSTDEITVGALAPSWNRNDLSETEHHGQNETDDDVLQPYGIGGATTLPSVAAGHRVPVRQIGEITAPHAFGGDRSWCVAHISSGSSADSKKEERCPLTLISNRARHVTNVAAELVSTW